MLVLSRKKNETIVIKDDITITVVDIRGDKVRLGIDAPKDVPVHRREVYEAIKRSGEPQGAQSGRLCLDRLARPLPASEPSSLPNVCPSAGWQLVERARGPASRHLPPRPSPR